jgi:predicted Zn-dependent peptidase
MNKMVQTEIQFGKFVEINEILSSLEKVTLSNIQTMANELFQESKFHYYLLTPNKD